MPSTPSASERDDKVAPGLPEYPRYSLMRHAEPTVAVQHRYM